MLFATAKSYLFEPLFSIISSLEKSRGERLEKSEAGEQAPRPSGGVCGPDSAACGGRARCASCVARPKRKALRCATLSEFRALREYTHALRLVSKLPDLRAGYADRILRARAQSPMRFVRSTAKKKSTAYAVLFFLEAPPGIGPGNKGFADLCLTAWLWRRIN